MKQLYIFDLDGTIANLTHRLHFINFNASIHGFEKDFKKNWPDFFANVKWDWPINNNIRTLNAIYAEHEVWFFTGRMDMKNVREDTLWWITEYTGIQNPNLTMRPNQDYRPDYKIKQEMFDNMLDEDKDRLIAVFDDRDQVVNMWRKNNVTCYQVAPGNF